MVELSISATFLDDAANHAAHKQLQRLEEALRSRCGADAATVRRAADGVPVSEHPGVYRITLADTVPGPIARAMIEHHGFILAGPPIFS